MGHGTINTRNISQFYKICMQYCDIISLRRTNNIGLIIISPILNEPFHGSRINGTFIAEIDIKTLHLICYMHQHLQVCRAMRHDKYNVVMVAVRV